MSTGGIYLLKRIKLKLSFQPNSRFFLKYKNTISLCKTVNILFECFSALVVKISTTKSMLCCEALSHVTVLKSFLSKTNVVELYHFSYFPNLISSNCVLFQKLKLALKVRFAAFEVFKPV